MAAPTFVTDHNDAALARVIKQGAILIRDVSTTDIPTGTNWVPAVTDDIIGYYSEDGFTLSREAGSSTDFLGHNKDIVLSEEDPGYWTIAFAGIESNKVTIETYFETEIDGSGAVTVTESGLSKRFDIVTVGYSQAGETIIVHYPNVQISGREGLQFSASTLLAYGMTFRTFKGRSAVPYHLKAWGLESAGTANPAGTVFSVEVTGTPSGGTYILSVDGVDSSAIAYDANAAAVQSALNGIAGVSGATVSGTAVKTATFTNPVVLTADGSSLSGGTDPDVVVTKVS